MRFLFFRTALIVSVLVLITPEAFSQLTSKEASIIDLRQYFSKHAFRGHQLDKGKAEQLTGQQCVDLLGSDGRFVDLVDEQDSIEQKRMFQSQISAQQDFVSEVLEKAFNRMWRIAETFRGKNYQEYKSEEAIKKLFIAINNYSEIESRRGSIGAGRFHISCFAIPTAAVNTYFCLLDVMDCVEEGEESLPLAISANKYLLEMSYQSWTQPYRNDSTDANPVSVDRFRKHVWWVGGNGLGYRSVFPTAVAKRSIPMLDVLAEVSKGALSFVSQNTYDDAFWTEGFSADGAGWGHGMQCLIWGYPISGTSAALELFEYFKGTPWANQLSESNAYALINYFRGSSWYYYKGYIPRCLDRQSMNYSEMKAGKIKTAKMIGNTVDNWLASFPKKEQKELLDLKKDLADNQIVMDGSEPGFYNGTRWFFNNDNLIKKNPDYYILVSMASRRCDGIESFHKKADSFNFFTCDGMTFFQKEGNEYNCAIGGWNLTAIPGVTSRQGEDRLIPITNWRGYCSKYNFAAAATRGGENAACGFIFEKMNASDKKDVNDKEGSNDPNEWIYGVKATKGYFMVDDYMIALGSGITNLLPEMAGDIWTTIDQTQYNGSLQYFSNKEVVNVQGGVVKEFDEKTELVWVSQRNGFSYAVLPKHTTGRVHLLAETRETKWPKLNDENKKLKNLPLNTEIFQLYIDHGRQVDNGTYAYVVYGGKEEPKQAFEMMPLKILSNTTGLQAVGWGENYVGAAFYNPEITLKVANSSIQVSAPCALLLEKTGNQYSLTVTDAEMNKELKSIEVRTTIPVKGESVKRDGKWYVILVPMPQGAMCGKPATVNVVARD